jgi:hypothetical protein
MEAKKSDTGKARLDLLPPELMLSVSHVLAYGAEKYSERNWELGSKWGRYYAALQRHMLAWWAGEDTDEETGMSHLWHAGCCIAFLIAYESRGVGTDDRPNKERVNDSIGEKEGFTSQVTTTDEVVIGFTEIEKDRNK